MLLASSTCLVSHLLFFFFRWTLESLAQLEPRRSALEDDFEEEEEKDEDEQLTTGLDDGHDKVCVLVLWLSHIFPFSYGFICSSLDCTLDAGLLSWSQSDKGKR